MSIELPVATRPRCDMTEELLKVTLNPNKQQQQPGLDKQCRPRSDSVAPEGESDEGLHCLPFCLCHCDALTVKPPCSNFKNTWAQLFKTNDVVS